MFLKELEKILDYRFKNKNLLQEAFTHKSYLNESKRQEGRDNERLEFLGDAVLDLVISEQLMIQNPLFPEGDLSKMKSKMVSERALERVSRRMNLGKFLFLGKGEELTGGREKASLLADSLEAIIAAIYIDGGFASAKRFTMLAFSPEFESLDQSKELQDFKTELQEYCQREFDTLPKYNVLKEIGPDHKKIFEVEISIKGKLLGSGKGRSKKEAEQQSARKALEKLTKTLQ